MDSETPPLLTTFFPAGSTPHWPGIRVQRYAETSLDTTPPPIADIINDVNNGSGVRHWYTYENDTIHSLNVAVRYEDHTGNHVAVISHTSSATPPVSRPYIADGENTRAAWEAHIEPAHRTATPLPTVAVTWAAVDPGELFERIADQLHDSTMQTLAAAVMQIAVITRTLDPDSDIAHQLADIGNLIQQSSGTLRKVVETLRTGFAGFQPGHH